VPGFAEGAVKPMTSDEQVAKYIERARRHVELGRLLIERHKEWSKDIASKVATLRPLKTS
jgi:hypothetical protein